MQRSSDEEPRESLRSTTMHCAGTSLDRGARTQHDLCGRRAGDPARFCRRIAPGAKADFVMVDTAHPAMQLLYDPVRRDLGRERVRIERFLASNEAISRAIPGGHFGGVGLDLVLFLQAAATRWQLTFWQAGTSKVAHGNPRRRWQLTFWQAGTSKVAFSYITRSKSRSVKRYRVGY